MSTFFPKRGHPKLRLNHCSASEKWSGGWKHLRRLRPDTDFGVGYLHRSMTSHCALWVVWYTGVLAEWLSWVTKAGLMRSVSNKCALGIAPLSDGIFITAIRNRVCPSSSGKVQQPWGLLHLSTQLVHSTQSVSGNSAFPSEGGGNQSPRSFKEKIEKPL